jgi:acid stress-induced BolA-like protein IbaG/YrbA
MRATMTEQEIQTLIEQGLPGSTVSVQGDGRHFDATITAEQFSGLLPVARQQLVYKALGDKISTGEIHAFSMKTLTPTKA